MLCVEWEKMKADEDGGAADVMRVWRGGEGCRLYNNMG